MRWLLSILVLSFLTGQTSAQPSPGNRLAYLDELDPYYPHRKFPKLITPQWVGEDGVEAVVILGIDDMRDPKKYETFLRPILGRLKKIDGRAPVSIMTCSIDPKDEQLQKWLKEGLSLECHTIDHPCPFFKLGFEKAKATYDKCIDLLNEVPNNKPVAFRMPCCDSLNTPSPRFYAEIFNKTTPSPPGGEGRVRGNNFLTIDTSVFNLFTSNDKELPRDLVLNADGTERFRKYLPKDRSFVNYIEDYPYPYVIGRLCWQFPCMTPSDWQAQHLHGKNNPQTVKDWQAALDCTVIKQGVFCLVFHPHGWIKAEQVVELIDHAVAKHGKKVKFLTFKEAQERLDKNLTASQAIRNSKNGADSQVVLLDLNQDGYLDVLRPHARAVEYRIWKSTNGKWTVKDAPFAPNLRPDFRSFFGTLTYGGRHPSFLTSESSKPLVRWIYEKQLPGWAWSDNPLEGDGVEIKYFFASNKEKNCFALRDLDGDGQCEIIVSRGNKSRVIVWSARTESWHMSKLSLPSGACIAKDVSDCGTRFLDLDGDGKLDILFSNEKEYGIYLFTDMKQCWSRKVMAGKRGDKDALPMIARNGTNNGFFVHSGSLWWSNEDTVLLKDHVDRREIKKLLGK